jgi:uncharacterized protein
MTTPAHVTPPSELFKRMSSDLSLRSEQVARTVGLLQDDATVPFIARYRKEVTGNLDEEEIRRIAQRHRYYTELEQRRTTVLNTVMEQDKLTEPLRQQIIACFDKAELEDLYRPFRPKRQTKATVAIEQGLEPLAKFIWEQQPGEQSIEALAASYLNAEKGIEQAEQALTGAGHIIAERIADQIEIRKVIRRMMLRKGMIQSVVAQGKADHKSKFQDYYDFREPATSIPSHRILAILRGVREGILTMSIEVDTEQALATIKKTVITQPDTAFAPYLAAYCEDAFHRLLYPSLQNEVRRLLKEHADTDAIVVFQDNLRSLLLASPLGSYGVLGIDPALRTGCKLAVVDHTGKFLQHAVIYPHKPKQDTEGAQQVLLDLIQRHQIRAIAVGNGTASRETDSLVRQLIQTHNLSELICVIVNEAGASVYSASRLARHEFPDLDVTIRGAISIARRLQDPLAELVKIDPKAIGVGQYQHDVDQKHLRHSLAETVESCVNHVGADANTASAALLQYVAGLSIRQAQNVVAYRDANGPFNNRQQFVQVNGIGEKTFQQAAGFLRIKSGDNPLDNTAVHPETYQVVEQMADSLAIPIADLIAKPELITSLDLNQFVNEQVGLPTLEDIRQELLKPGRDPRQAFVAPQFRTDITTLNDLQEGMELEGVISNVTNFGAFVDIGIHQDGLVHISELTQRYVRDPREVVQVGQVIRVKVLEIDVALKRISLSMKALEPPQAPAPNPPPRANRTTQRKRNKTTVPKRVNKPPSRTTVETTEVQPAAPMEERLRALQAHFQGDGSK